MASSQSTYDDAVAGPEQWVDLYGNYMYRYALSRVADKETAQDLVQEALVAAIKAFERFQGRSSIKTWLIAILKRKIVDHYRRRSNQYTTDDIEVVANNLDQLFDETGHWRVTPNEWTVNPSTAYEQREFMDVLYLCLAQLPARLSEIFMLREFEEMSTGDICRQLSITESNLWVMMYRARMQLRSCLETKWLDEAK
ncbi:MAG: sigma-70 family RNA polymerase sigma factor [Desulfobacteraceae bacterium]|jgi:RNA polymerase sigma-70 factor (ECF subfamily)